MTAITRPSRVGGGIHSSRSPIIVLLALGVGATSADAQLWAPDDGRRLLTIDHYVPVVSIVPAIEGEIAQIYVREKVAAGTLARARDLTDQVVLFVHGAGTPAEVAFDPPAEGYSWMGHLAEAGFDVFSMDMTGYGRSTRPSPMGDPCNLSQAQQADLIPALLPSPCPATYPHALTHIASDWHDLDAVVEYLRELRDVEQVALVAWSLGGPRAGGYAALHPEKVSRLILLAPAYSRTRATEAPAVLPAPGTAMSRQSWQDFSGNWNRQTACPAQYDPRVAMAVWSAMLESDPVGATWGSGVRRAPSTTVWGWGPAQVGTTTIPTLLIAPLLDGQVSPDRVTELYEDLGSEAKVLLEMECSSHNAMWEETRLTLYDASLEWLRSSSVDGRSSGVLRR